MSHQEILAWDVIPILWENLPSYSKTCLSGHSKIDKTKILMTNGSVINVESIAECSLVFLVFVLSGRLRQVLLYLFDPKSFKTYGVMCVKWFS